MPQIRLPNMIGVLAALLIVLGPWLAMGAQLDDDAAKLVDPFGRKSLRPGKEALTPPTLSPQSESPYEIELAFVSQPSSEILASFEFARQRWMSVISESLPSRATIPAGNWCGYENPTTRVVNDILISVDVTQIDGQGSVLGQAGPCLFDNTGMPRFGIMQFDIEDVKILFADGSFPSVVLHEMGHVLGIGSLWQMFGLIDLSQYPAEITYTGTEGNIGNGEVGRSGPAIVETLGGAGTAGSHWKEDPPGGYDTELMTGYSERGVEMPLSKLTVRALRDLGYSTDINEADPFTAPPYVGFMPDAQHDEQKQNKRAYGNDVLRFEYKEVPAEAKPGRAAELEELRIKLQGRREELRKPH